MIQHFDELAKSAGQIKGGKGIVSAASLLDLADFNGKGRLFNHSVLKSGCSVGLHKHDGEMEVYYILKGQGVYDDNGTLIPVAAGDVTLCRNGESHMLENTGTEDLEFIALILFV